LNGTVSRVGVIFVGLLIFTGGILPHELVNKITSRLQYVVKSNRSILVDVLKYYSNKIYLCNVEKTYYRLNCGTPWI
jgi:hypothetical protein